MLTILDLVEQDTSLHRASFRELAGPCPNPDCSCRHDGFHVDLRRNPVRKRDESGQWMDDETLPPQGGFRCRGCWPSEELLPDGGRRRGWGTPLDYLMHVRKMSKVQARAYLKTGEETPSQPGVARGWQYDRENYRAESWQQATHETMQECIARLWDSSDTTALDYLHGRGLSDELIRKARMGYSLKGDIPRLIIPSVNQGCYVAIYRRDLRPDVPHDQRWKDAPGGTKSELYLADCLAFPQPTILTEAPLDALSVVQACGYDVNIVATGGTNCARLTPWIARLRKMPRVYVAFDADEAGDEAADWWLKRLPNAQRLRPLSHDLNAMLMEGYDLRCWIVDAVQACSECQRPLSESEENLDLEFRFDPHGKLYCMDHYPTSDAPIVEDPADVKTEAEPSVLSSDVPDTSDDERLETFASALVQIARAYPVPCTLTVNPPGYTIEDRAREVRAELEAQREQEAEQVRQRQQQRKQARRGSHRSFESNKKRGATQSFLSDTSR